MRLLLAEDDLRMAGLIGRGLREEGIAADVVDRGERALELARSGAYDAIVLDVMLPGIDGFETCRQLRAMGVWVPILMLSARGDVEDRVTGLNQGADDYLTKPFAFAELLARIHALVRRGAGERPAILRCGDLVLDPGSHTVARGETEIALSSLAFSMLELLMRRAGQTLSREQLVESSWDRTADHRSNVIEVYIRTLRERVDRPFGVESIETVRGVGYRMRKDGGR